MTDSRQRDLWIEIRRHVLAMVTALDRYFGVGKFSEVQPVTPSDNASVTNML
jgi:hypothetical protein